MPGIPNSGAAGSVLDAVNSGLVRVAGPAIRTPGVVGNYLSSPPGAAAFTGPLEVVIRAQCNDWSFGNQCLVAQWSSGAEVFVWQIVNDGSFQFYANPTYGGGTFSQTVPPLTNGLAYWLKVTHDTATGVVTFFWAPDSGTEPTVWTSIAGSAVNVVGVRDAAVSEVRVGAYNAGGISNPFTGQIKRVIIRNGVGGAVVYDMNADRATDPAALTFQASTGQTVTVNRSASGPVTTIVPAGAVVYVNPDSANGANRATVADNAAFDVAAGEDAVIMWCGQLGHVAAVGTEGVLFGFNSFNSMYAYTQPSSLQVTALLADSDSFLLASTADFSARNKMVAVLVIANRFEGLLKIKLYDSAGLISSGSTTLTGIGNVLPSGERLAMLQRAGSFSSLAWDKGVGIAPTDAEALAIARRLLVQANRPAVNVTGTVPPISPVYGDRWRASNGHVAFYDGAQWTAVTPTTGVNVAVLLGNATLWLDAAGSTPGEQFARNRGTGGEALNARYGSTASADTNDPLVLPWNGENYIYLSGITGNRMTVPPSAAPNVVGDTEIVVRCNNADWSSGFFQILVSKTGAGYELYVSPTGYLEANLNSGVAGGTKTFSTQVLPPLRDGETYWLRVAIDVDNGSGGTTATFYYAADQPSEPSAWTLVQAVTVAGTLAPVGNNDFLFIGDRSAGASYPWHGSVYRAIVKNGIGGSAVFDFNAAVNIVTGSESTFAATTGQTVTVTRTATGRKTVLVTRPVWLLGTDDYMEIPDNPLLDFAAGESFTVMGVYRYWGSTDGYILDKSAALDGFRLRPLAATDLGQFLLYQSPFPSDFVATTKGPLIGLFGVRDVAADKVYAARTVIGAGVADTTTGSLNNASSMLVGGVGTDMECVAVALFRRALTAAEIAAINAYYGTV